MSTSATTLSAHLSEWTDRIAERAAVLSECILDHAVKSVLVIDAKAAMDLIADAALLNPDVILGYTNEKQRVAARDIYLAADDRYLAAKEHHDGAVLAKAKTEGRVDEARALLSIAKRHAEMTVALARLQSVE